jgi:hypothetical protein
MRVQDRLDGLSAASLGRKDSAVLGNNLPRKRYAVLILFSLAVCAACGSDSEESPQGGGSGGSAGQATGGTGGSETGGTGGTGGSETGGTGGSETGGTGGSETGGTGGSETGGTGGSETGGTGGSAGQATGGSAGAQGSTCSEEPTAAACNSCCRTEIPAGPAAMAEMVIAACLCQPQFCATPCSDFCSDPAAAGDLSQQCMTCYSSTFPDSEYQACYKEADADCQADATCAAYSACITSCMGLP